MTQLVESDVAEIKRRSFLGAVVLTGRTFLLQIVALLATLILTILLDPSVFGVFFVVTAVVNFLNYFSDVGLAAALIQKQNEPDMDDYKSTFTLQQILVLTVAIIAFLLTPVIDKLYNFGPNGIFLFRALVIAFILSSLKTIPSVMLERKLEFAKLVWPQIVENLVYHLTAIILAVMGFGIMSFAWAAILRGISGLATLYLIQPWKPQLGINKKHIRSLLSFGIPYQGNALLGLIKDDLITAYLGTILPFAAVGYIGWAKKWAEIALRLIMDNIIKVTFPTFSRLQHDSQFLKNAINKTLKILSLFILPLAIGMVFMIKPLMEIIPRYDKWQPAIFSFYLFTFSAVLATISSPLVNALNAIGKVKISFFLMLMWTVLTWALVPLFVSWYGLNGVALAAFVISLTSLIPLLILKKFVKVTLLQQITVPLMGSIWLIAVLWLLKIVLSAPVLFLIGGTLFGSLFYTAYCYRKLKDELQPYIAIILTPNRLKMFKHFTKQI